MSIEITGVTIAHRKKTAAEWADSEYVLAGAEWGYETDTGKVKIGDGATPWGSLDYFGGDVDLSGYATEAWVENKGYVSNAQIDIDETLSSDSDALIPSQKAVKAYVDNNAGGGGTPAGDDGALQFNDSGIFGGSNRFRINENGSMELLDSSENVIKTLNATYTLSGVGTIPVYSNDVWNINGVDVSVLSGAIPAAGVPLVTRLEFDYDAMPNGSSMSTHLLDWNDTGSSGFAPTRIYHSLDKSEEGVLSNTLNLGYIRCGIDVDGKTFAVCNADEVSGLESRVGTFPLAFDIERTYGSKETPLAGNLGWTKSGSDKRVYQEVYHNSATAPTELASMAKVGDGVYMPSETNLIYIWCSLPNATNTEDGYFYTVTQV